MTPKEKAQELLDNYKPILPHYTHEDNARKAKQCSLICVDEILNSQPTKPCEEGDLYDNMVSAESYWTQVRNELEKL